MTTIDRRHKVGPIFRQSRGPTASNNGSGQLDRSQKIQARPKNPANSIVTFAIIIPITSYDTCNDLQDLKTLAESIIHTTWRDRTPSDGVQYHIQVYLAINRDFLLEGGKAEVVLKEAGLKDVISIASEHPPGHVYPMWRECARRGWADGCDYFVLMKQDAELLDEGWMRGIEKEFHGMADQDNGPAGLGCVVFTDDTFRYTPTFPVLHRTHLDIFQGEIVPPNFIDWDGDSFLVQLYHRWNRSSVIQRQVRTNVERSTQTRNEKKLTPGWKFRPLDTGTQKVETWLSARGDQLARKLTLDVIVPCFRVQLPLLDRILQLQSSLTCTVMFIIIIDNPDSPDAFEVQNKYGSRADVRIRVNRENLGAGASRNRGLREASAEWVHFLDDDVVPEPDLLVESEKAIRAHPQAAGFVGNVQFPPADTIATAAIKLAGVTYFWDIATKITEDVPWGITANLIVRRSVLGMDDPDIQFDLRFPKTGGGEDIDFCLKKRRACVERGGEGFRAAPHVLVTHPWWNNGGRSYTRFFKWAEGDGALIKMWPQHAYAHWLPNSGETLMFSVSVFLFGVLVATMSCSGDLALFGTQMAISSIAAGMIHDMLRHLWRHPERNWAEKHPVGGLKWLLAIMESTIVRMTSEAGRAVGMVERGEFLQLGRRFDWFTMRFGSGPRDEEAQTEYETTVLWVALTAALRCYTYL